MAPTGNLLPRRHVIREMGSGGYLATLEWTDVRPCVPHNAPLGAQISSRERPARRSYCVVPMNSIVDIIRSRTALFSS